MVNLSTDSAVELIHVHTHSHSHTHTIHRMFLTQHAAALSTAERLAVPVAM